MQGGLHGSYNYKLLYETVMTGAQPLRFGSTLLPSSTLVVDHISCRHVARPKAQLCSLWLQPGYNA